MLSLRISGFVKIGLAIALVMALGLWDAAAWATTAADVCAFGTNDCTTPICEINTTTPVQCNSVLDFLAEGCDEVIINTGGILDLEVGDGCSMFIQKTGDPTKCPLDNNDLKNHMPDWDPGVGNLTIKGGGFIRRPKSTNIPGCINIKASGTITVEPGGNIDNIGGRGPDHPEINLEAELGILMDGIITARGTTFQGAGGHVYLGSKNGSVTISGDGQVIALSKDAGGSRIFMKGCGIILEPGAVLDAFAKKRGTEIVLSSHEEIIINGATMLANIKRAPIGPGAFITIEARTNILINSSLIQANAKEGGTIHIFSADQIESGDIVVDANSVIEANATESDAREINIFNALGDIDICGVVSSNGTGSGTGGNILIQAFRSDVVLCSADPARPIITATGGAVGTISIISCTPIAGGSTSINPAPVLAAGNCADPIPDPEIQPLGFCPVICVCLTRFGPTEATQAQINPGPFEVRIFGETLTVVTAVRFSPSGIAGECDPTSGTAATITSQTADELKVEVPAGLGVGDYHIILIGPTSSICSTELFTVNP